jgi:hypothetical protein
MPRPQKEVIGVGQDDLGPYFSKGLGKNRLDGPLGPDGHENRSFDGPVWGVKTPSPGLGRAILL